MTVWCGSDVCACACMFACVRVWLVVRVCLSVCLHSHEYRMWIYIYIECRINICINYCIKLRCCFFILMSQLLISFCKSLLPSFTSKWPMRLELKFEIEWHSKNNRLYTKKFQNLTFMCLTYTFTFACWNPKDIASLSHTSITRAHSRSSTQNTIKHINTLLLCHIFCQTLFQFLSLSLSLFLPLAFSLSPCISLSSLSLSLSLFLSLYLSLSRQWGKQTYSGPAQGWFIDSAIHELIH